MIVTKFKKKIRRCNDVKSGLFDHLIIDSKFHVDTLNTIKCTRQKPRYIDTVFVQQPKFLNDLQLVIVIMWRKQTPINQLIQLVIQIH